MSNSPKDSDTCRERKLAVCFRLNPILFTYCKNENEFRDAEALARRTVSRPPRIFAHLAFHATRIPSFAAGYHAFFVLREFHPEWRAGGSFSPEGGIASQTDNVRRTARSAWRKESRSGSSATDKAASCINSRTAKCANKNP